MQSATVDDEIYDKGMNTGWPPFTKEDRRITWCTIYSSGRRNEEAIDSWLSFHGFVTLVSKMRNLTQMRGSWTDAISRDLVGLEPIQAGLSLYAERTKSPFTMKFTLSRAIFLLCTFTVIAMAMPAFYADEDVEVRSDLTFELEGRDGFDDILDSRRMGGVGDVVEMIINVVGSIKAGIAADKNARSGFTQDLVGKMNAKNPKFNYVICHTKHKTAFDGKQGTDWGHSHQEFDIKVGGTVGYEIYWAKSGKFTREGDGGFLNWAYIGNIKSKSSDGKEIVFGPR